MEMSLDDIIKTRKIGIPAKKFVPKSAVLTVRKTSFKPAYVTDARNTIIQKNRLKIRDARDKLIKIARSSGDVRNKLNRKQLIANQYRSVNVRTGGRGLDQDRSYVEYASPRPQPRQLREYNDQRDNRMHVNVGQTRRVSNRFPALVEIPRGYIDYDNMEDMEQEEYSTDSRLSRTVKNDAAFQDGGGFEMTEELISPSSRHIKSSWNRYDAYERTANGRHERRISPRRSEITPPSPPLEILRPQRHNSSLYERRYVPEPSSHLSGQMRSRLEHAPDPHISMGIFSKSAQKRSLVEDSASTSGHRIVVSNLHTDVTQADIRELFEDIGHLYDARIVRPGVAEVIYKSLAEAEKAVDTYHNRQLDGLPMKCLLVNVRASNKPTAPAIRTSHSGAKRVSGKTPFEIDIDALHKVLFQR